MRQTAVELVTGSTQYIGTEIKGNTAANNGGGLYQRGNIVISGGSLADNVATSAMVEVFIQQEFYAPGWNSQRNQPE